MTTVSLLPAATREDLVLPAAVGAEEAVRKVARRLPERVPLAASLYHHPFLGLAFLCTPPSGHFARWTARTPVLAHIVVDLVSGRAFLSDPWNEDSFTTQAAALQAADPTAHHSAAVRGPAPRVSRAAAVEAGRILLAGVLARRRRVDPVGPAELHAEPVRFGKPNWWVTGRRGERTVEVIVDALSGRHYVCSG